MLALEQTPSGPDPRWVRPALAAGTAFPVLVVAGISLLSKAWPADLRRPSAELYAGFTGSEVDGFLAEALLRGALISFAVFVIAVGTRLFRHGDPPLAMVALVAGSVALAILSVGAMALDTGAHMARCAALGAGSLTDECGTGQMEPQLFEALSSLGFYSAVTLAVGPLALLAASVSLSPSSGLPSILRIVGVAVAASLVLGVALELFDQMALPVFLIWMAVAAVWMAAKAPPTPSTGAG